MPEVAAPAEPLRAVASHVPIRMFRLFQVGAEDVCAIRLVPQNSKATTNGLITLLALALVAKIGASVSPKECPARRKSNRIIIDRPPRPEQWAENMRVVSQIAIEWCCSSVDAMSEVLVEMKPREALPDIEAAFRTQYTRLARVIASVIRDPARAEELAVEVFLKWSRTPKAQGENVEGWLYRAAVRVGQNELRQQIRRRRYESLFSFGRATPTPEELFGVREEQQRVDMVLSVLGTRQAELLVLRSHGFSYDELASTLDLNPVSVGTLLSRAQQAFRKEYIQRYEKR